MPCPGCHPRSPDGLLREECSGAEVFDVEAHRHGAKRVHYARRDAELGTLDGGAAPSVGAVLGTCDEGAAVAVSTAAAVAAAAKVARDDAPMAVAVAAAAAAAKGEEGGGHDTYPNKEGHDTWAAAAAKGEEEGGHDTYPNKEGHDTWAAAAAAAGPVEGTWRCVHCKRAWSTAGALIAY